MSAVFGVIDDAYEGFGTERVLAFSVAEDGVKGRLPHRRTFIKLRDNLFKARDEYQNHKKGCDSTFLVVVGEVFKGLDSCINSIFYTLHSLEPLITKVRAAVLGALAFADALFDDNYRPKGSGEEGKDMEAETLVRTLKNTLDAITPENLNLDGQTLLLVDITARPENLDKVVDAVRQFVASLSNHPSIEGSSIGSYESRLL